jgi:hypothetical protein
MKHFYRIFALFFCFLATAIVANAELPALQGGVMLSCSGLPCVDIALKNGKHLRMLVDLGDENSIVDSAVAKDLGLAVEPASVTDRSGKAIPGYGSATLEGARLGDASLGNIPVLVVNIASAIKKDEMPPADGVLSYPAFKDRLLRLDYKRKTVSVSELLTADPPCPGFCGNVTQPTFGNGRPHVLVTTGFSVNGKPITAQIDTLYSGTMLIYPTAVDKLGLKSESATSATQLFPYTDGGVTMKEAHARKEAFGSKELAGNGPLFFATAQVHVPDGMFDGTVGQGLLAGHVVYLDFHSNHFWMTN